jgi:uroporphyrinogen III methyltransferase / synthase
MLMPASGTPLAKKNIAITRPLEQASGVVERLHTLGANPIATPTIEIVAPLDFAPLDFAVKSLSSYDWLLFTSVNGVQIFMGRSRALQIDLPAYSGLRIGAIGPATARAIKEYGGTVTFVPSSYRAESILAEIGDVSGKRLLLPRAELARPVLAVGLRELGATVDEIPAYRTIPGPGTKVLAGLLQAGGVDAIAFTSSSTVRFFYEGLWKLGMTAAETERLLAATAIVCIGPVTAGTAEEMGLHVDVVAEEFTIDGLIAALVEFFSKDRPTGSE